MNTTFPKRLRTVFTYDDKSDPPSLMLTQAEEGVEKMSGVIILTEDVFIQILESVSEVRPDFARECARVYWRVSKRKKREPGDALDEVKIIDHVKPEVPESV